MVLVLLVLANFPTVRSSGEVTIMAGSILTTNTATVTWGATITCDSVTVNATHIVIVGYHVYDPDCGLTITYDSATDTSTIDGSVSGSYTVTHADQTVNIFTIGYTGHLGSSTTTNGDRKSVV